MGPVKRTAGLASRVYALTGALLVILFLPLAAVRLGTERRPPVRLGLSPGRDGSVGGTVVADGRRLRVAEVSIGGGPKLPAGGAEVAGTLDYLPAGTVVTFTPHRSEPAATPVAGAVVETAAPPEKTVLLVVLTVLAVVFSLAGAGMAVGGLDRPSICAAAVLAGFGHLAAGYFLEPNASMVRDPALRNGLVLLWVSFPRHLAFFFLIALLSVFPSDLHRSRVSRAGGGTVALLAGVQAFLVPAFQVPGLLERLPVSWQAALIVTSRQMALVIFALGFSTALVLLSLQVRASRRRRLPEETRRRARLVGAALAAGVGPAAVLGILQALFAAFSGHKPVPPVAMSLALLATVAVPLGLFHAMMAPRAQSVGILVRRAVLFGFAARSVRVASLLPLAALGLLLYRSRSRPLAEVLAERPGLFAVAAVAAYAGLRYADVAHARVERLFFRRREDPARAVQAVTESLSTATDAAHLGTLLSAATERTLGLDSAAVFVRSSAGSAFACPDQPLSGLDASSPIVEALEKAEAPLDVASGGRGGPLAALPELERYWLERLRARLLVPLKSSSKELMAVLVVGEKLSELPFEGEDRQLLAAVAGSAALALENLLLRSSGGGSHGRPATDAPEVHDLPTVDVEAGQMCPKCSRIFGQETASCCGDHGEALAPADVPLLLAGKYRFERRIGAGGMGVVYKARDLELSRDVAIKTLPRVSADAARRLRREARAAARLIHPHLALIFATETWRGAPMLILEYLEGGTLASRIGKGPLPVPEVVRWGIQLAGALDFAHRRGILHRDIKPSNIGFTAGDDPKLLDFGLARLLEEPEIADRATGAGAEPPGRDAPAANTPLTSSSRVVGTVPYLAPEALTGASPSPSFDLWGLSLTLYEAVTGANPFLGKPAEGIAGRILTTSPPDPRTLRPDCPHGLALLLGEALARSPSRRPGSARDLGARLAALG